MDKLLKIMLGVAGGIATLAVVFIIVGLIFGATRGQIFKQLESESGAAPVLKNLELNEFENVYIDIDLGDVKVVEAENFGVEINYNSQGKADYSINDNTLTINCSTQKNIFRFFNFGKVIENIDNEVTVYIQKDYPVNIVRIDNSCGNVEISDIEIESLHMAVDLGNAIVSNSQCGEIQIDCSCGNTKLNQVSSDKINIKNELGNIDGENMECKDTYANNSCGNTSLEGTLTGSINLINDLGNCKVNIKGVQDNYNFDLKTSLGKVNVNDVNHETEYIVQNNAQNELHIDNSCGKISVNFEPSFLD